MIPRYIRPEMASIWSDSARLTLWCRIEVALAQEQAEHGLIPAKAALAIETRATYDEALLERSVALEQETKHDVAAFTRALAERVGEDYGRFVHFGATSSDILDTGLALQLTQASDLLLQGLDGLLSALKTQAEQHKFTPCLGRSHGMAAEPTTFGLKLAGFYAEFHRARQRLQAARAEIAIAMISGAVGTYAFLSPAIERGVAKRLGLVAETISTQVVPRDRHAMFFATLAVIASSLERLGVEIRHLQRSEVAEVAEHFASRQVGSSSMPHKRNPIVSENLCGLARLVRMAVVPALENVALWHERDISHSSVERVIAPDATLALDFALARVTGLVAGLDIFPQRMAQNMERSSAAFFSQQLMLLLVDSGLERAAAHRIAQEVSERAEQERRSYLDIAREDSSVRKSLRNGQLSTLEHAQQPEHYMRHVDEMFARLF